MKTGNRGQKKKEKGILFAHIMSDAPPDVHNTFLVIWKHSILLQLFLIIYVHIFRSVPTVPEVFVL